MSADGPDFGPKLSRRTCVYLFCRYLRVVLLPLTIADGRHKHPNNNNNHHLFIEKWHLQSPSTRRQRWNVQKHICLNDSCRNLVASLQVLQFWDKSDCFSFSYVFITTCYHKAPVFSAGASACCQTILTSVGWQATRLYGPAIRLRWRWCLQGAP